MDQITISSVSITSTSNSQSTNGVHGHNHHGNMADKIKKMETAIDNAVKDGKLTDDQASDMKKKLDDVSSKIGQPGDKTKLSNDDKKAIRDEMQSVRKELFSALNPQSAQGVQGVQSNTLSDIFSSLDKNGDGTLDQSEFSAMMNNPAIQKAFNIGVYNANGNVGDSSQGTINLSA
jgi:hypothetical protein